jgi:DNA polymerase
MRGQVFHYGEDRTPVIVTYHPAYLLRRPGEKGKVWLDLLLAARIVEGKSH